LEDGEIKEYKDETSDRIMFIPNLNAVAQNLDFLNWTRGASVQNP
jgi:hypothetical protein